MVACFSSINASDDIDIITYNELSFIARHIPKDNVQIISGDMNTTIGKDENNKFDLPNLPNRNGEHETHFSPENNFSWLYTKFNSSRAIMFTFGQIPLGKVWTPLSSQLWVK